jgi:hypothetical protein
MPDETPGRDPLPQSHVRAAADARVAVDGLTASQQQLNSELALSGQESRRFGQALTQAFLGLVAHGRSFGDVLRSLLASLSRMALGIAFRPLESLLGGALQGILSGFSGAAVQLPAGTPPPIGAGGHLAAPQGFPVGATRRLATAAGSAPLAATAGGAAGLQGRTDRLAPSIVLNVTTPDAESFRRSETQIAALLARAVAAGQRNL